MTILRYDHKPHPKSPSSHHSDTSNQTKMFLLLMSIAASRNPILMIPGSFRSKLNIKVDRDGGGFCSKKIDNKFFWINPKYFIPPFLGCFIDWMTVEYDNKTGELKNRDGIDIFPSDFGGLDDVRGTGPKVFGQRLNYFGTIISELEKRDYREGVDLFAAPYDWRFGAAQPEWYYDKLRSLVEKAYYSSGNKTVSMVAHSLGAQLQHIFLTEKTTPEWRRKFINSSTLIAPSWSGTGVSFNVLWRIQIPFVSFFRLNNILEFARSLGTLHIHFPHFLGYKDTTLFVDPDGKNYTGDQVIDVLVKHNKILPRHIEMHEANLKQLRRWPTAPDVDTNILYNGGMKTAFGLKVSSWTSFGSTIYQRGDGLVGCNVIEWVIKNWKTDATIRYKNMDSPSRRFQHKRLLTSKESVQVLLDWIVPDIKVQNGSSHYEKEL